MNRKSICSKKDYIMAVEKEKKMESIDLDSNKDDIKKLDSSRLSSEDKYSSIRTSLESSIKDCYKESQNSSLSISVIENKHASHTLKDKNYLKLLEDSKELASIIDKQNIRLSNINIE